MRAATLDEALAGGDRVRLGETVFDTRSGELRRGSQRGFLEPREAQLLAELCRCAGRLVTREALLSTVWQGRLVGDEALSTAISRLRRQLGEDARILQTVHRRGYRLLADVACGPSRAREEDPLGDERLLRLGSRTAIREAASELEEALAKRPGDEIVLVALAELNIRGGLLGSPNPGRRFDAARALLAGVEAAGVARQRILVAQGALALFADLDGVRAADLLQEALEAGPIGRELRRYLAFALAVANRTVASLTAARDLVAAFPRSLSTRLAQLQVLLNAHEFQSAAEAAKETLTVFPDSSRALGAASLAMYGLGREEGAHRSLMRALSVEGLFGLPESALDRSFRRNGFRGTCSAVLDLCGSAGLRGTIQRLDCLNLAAIAGNRETYTSLFARARACRDPLLIWLRTYPFHREMACFGQVERRCVTRAC